MAAVEIDPTIHDFLRRQPAPVVHSTSHIPVRKSLLIREQQERVTKGISLIGKPTMGRKVDYLVIENFFSHACDCRLFEPHRLASAMMFFEPLQGSVKIRKEDA